MKGFFSIQMWFNFLLKLVDIVFPTTVVLLAFSWKGMRDLRKSPGFKFVAIFLFVVLASRIFLYMSGLPYQGRYLYPLAVLFSLAAAVGLEQVVSMLSKFKVFRSSAPWKISFAVILIVSMINAGKALSYSTNKAWVSDMPEFLKSSWDGKGKEPVLITSEDDLRLAYFSGYSYRYLTFSKFSRYAPPGTFKCQLQKMVKGQYDTLERVSEYNISSADDFNKAVYGGEAQRVFLFLDDDEKDLINMYKEEGISFPFKVVATFKEGRKKSFTLYERMGK